MSENARSRTGVLITLAATILLAGALVAGLLFPWVGGGGIVARNSASLLGALPSELTDETPSGNSKMLAADGKVITNFYENNRTPVKSDQIADVMKKALVDIEDSRFYEHNGLDVQGTMRALVKNVAAGSVQEGGSTLTQQLVKQTLLQTAPTQEERQAAIEENVGRKLREARLALALEDKYSKDEILTRYLNIVYFGQGAYGIEAAAQRYFSVHAKDLTLPQAAMLAGLVQSPTNDDPITEPANATKRRDQVLTRMHNLGDISAKELADNKGKPVAVKPGQAPPRGCIDASLGGFFCAYAYDYLRAEYGLSRDQIENGGLTIKTTLQPALQRSADQSVLSQTAMGAPLVGVFDAVDPKTGHVLAMSSNRRYGCDKPECESVNLNVSPAAGSGSTYKVFTAAAALSEGFGSRYRMYVPQPYRSKVFKGIDRDGNYGPLQVFNDNSHYKSTYDMTSGLVASANTYFVALEDAMGSISPVVDTAVKMGMTFDSPNQHTADWWKKNQNGTFTLGPEATSPLDLASAYGTVAASGTHCAPTPIVGVLDRDGRPLKDADGKVIGTGTDCTKGALKPGVANTLANMMVGVVSPSGTGRRAQIPGHQIAGKTGTTQENKTAAFVGMTPNYAVSVMLFDPRGKVFVGDHGGGKPAQIFHDAMAPILAREKPVAFPPADPAVERGTRAQPYIPSQDNGSGDSGSSRNRPSPTPTPTPRDNGGENGGGDGGNPGGGGTTTPPGGGGGATPPGDGGGGGN